MEKKTNKTKIKNTATLINAMETYISEYNLSIPDFAVKAKTTYTTAYNWISGISKHIRPSNWNNLYPLIKNYLPKHYNIYTGEIDSFIYRTGKTIGNSIKKAHLSPEENEILEKAKKLQKTVSDSMAEYTRLQDIPKELLDWLKLYKKLDEQDKKESDIFIKQFLIDRMK